MGVVLGITLFKWFKAVQLNKKLVKEVGELKAGIGVEKTPDKKVENENQTT